MGVIFLFILFLALGAALSPWWFLGALVIAILNV